MTVATSEHITTDETSLSDLVAHCSMLPPALGVYGPAIPVQGAPPAWSVGDACLAHVADLDDYGA